MNNNILIEFLNIDKLNQKSFLKIYEMLYPGSKPGQRSFMFLGYSKTLATKIKVYDLKKTKKKKEQVTQTDNRIIFYPDADMLSADVLSFLLDVQKEYRQTIKRIIKNEYDLTELNSLTKFVSLTWIAGPVFDVTFPPGDFRNILNQSLVMLFMPHYDFPYRRLRLCQTCKKIFFFKKPRAKFCGDPCRYAFHNKKNIESGDAKKYQRWGRANKPDIYLKK